MTNEKPASPTTTAKGVTEAFEAAMRQLTRVDIAQYLLSNTRARSNGAGKALAHAGLTKSYVAVIRGVDPDRVRLRCEADYKAVHDTTAEELTNKLDEVIGFDIDAFVDDDVAERFFKAFHRIALRVLGFATSSLPASPTQGELAPDRAMLVRARDWVADNIRESDIEGATVLGYLALYLNGSPALDRTTLPPTGDMVLVPREPTQEMLRAAINLKSPCTKYRDLYRAMVAAAPQGSLP